MEVEEGLEKVSGRGVREGVPASGRSKPIVINQELRETVMAFGKNHAELVGRLGADVVVNHLASGGRGRQFEHRDRRKLRFEVSCFMMHLVGTVGSSRQI